MANPGARRLECYTFNGDLESIWGNTSSQIDGFFGCCNPVHFAIFSDGRFVTSEKGIPRVKTYRENGDFEWSGGGASPVGTQAADAGIPVAARRSACLTWPSTVATGPGVGSWWASGC